MLLGKVKAFGTRGKTFLLTALLVLGVVVGSVPMTSPASAAIGSVTQYPLPITGSDLSRMGLGLDGNIWYTFNGPATTEGIGKLTASGNFTQYSAYGRYAHGIATGSDGNIWYSEQYVVNTILQYRIVKMSTNGTILNQYNIPSNKDISVMMLGPDGNIWFGKVNGGIGKIDTSGVITEYSAGAISGMTTGPDGNIWYTTSQPGTTIGNAIGKITPSGTNTVYQLSVYHAQPQGIASGSDGNLWFTESTTNKIGKITTSGVITKYSLPAGSSSPRDITTGSDGALWFTESPNKIGRITT